MSMFLSISKAIKTYDQEVKVGEEVNINLLFLDHDNKRIVYKLEMIHKEKKYLAATSEILSLYVDLNHRKVTEFEKEKSDLMDAFIEENKQDFKGKSFEFQKGNPVFPTRFARRT